MSITTCKICKKVYGQIYSLREHIKKCHPAKLELLEELAPLKTYKRSVVCNGCNKTFTTSFNLRKHIQNYHKDKLSELIKPKLPKSYLYKCDKCHKHFTHLRNLTYHKKSHGEQISRGLACILCRSNPDKEYFTEHGLIEHFRIRHDVNIIIKLINFASFSEFETWKKQEESMTNELFINLHGTKRKGNFAETRYTCHRSGYYKSRGKQLRRLKSQGSKKINGYCPAKMYVKNIYEKIEVQYISTHVGHSADLGHLNLNERERQTLAVQIAAKFPFHNEISQNSGEIPYLTIDENMHIKEEIPIVSSLLVSKSNGNDNKFMTDKEKFKLEFLQIVNSLECFEELDMVKKAVASVVPTLTAFRDVKNEEVCKNIEKKYLVVKRFPN